MTISQAFDKFIYDRTIYCSPETIKVYSSHLIRFWKYLELKYNMAITELDFGNIPATDNIYSGFIIYLREQRVRNVTIRSYCRAVKAYLRYCYDNDFCKDYVKGVKLPPDDSAPKMPLYVSEVELLDSIFDLNVLRDKRNYAIVHLMLDCGLRSQEVRHLDIKDLDPERNLLYLKTTKGEKSRIVLCPDAVFESVYAYLEDAKHNAGYVFRSLKNSDLALSKTAINSMFEDFRKLTGIKRLHAHLLRHTFATSYLIGGGNLEFLRVFMGHADYNVTKTYSQLAAQCKMLGVNVYKLNKIFFERGY